jgi:hypothetical protein
MNYNVRSNLVLVRWGQADVNEPLVFPAVTRKLVGETEMRMWHSLTNVVPLVTQRNERN